MNIEHCQFTGVKWDGQAIEAVNTVARALLNMTQLFQAQNIRIDTMIKVGEISVVDEKPKKKKGGK